ncbi:MAG: hypothetical protein Unbinned97contig1000_13 [Prokaryotic dsDNA virus sp.]|nr:MAG: hypothetical protein Unbinned97contig1000_13 [Prokaryotic dsDNA virus sp.]|tara:strand:- start:2672 stop:3046 length:375 start_codon:yes stop_codon:yes gene_type:complete
MPINYTNVESRQLAYNKIVTGLFDGTNEIVIMEGKPARSNFISKIIITNTDTASITPKIRIHNTTKSGEDDEYIQLMPEIELSVNERLVYESPITPYGGQNLVIELDASVTTNEPQYLMVVNNV